MLGKIKNKISIKILILLFVVIFVAVQVVTTVMVSEAFFNTETFLKSEKAQRIIKAPLSSQSHIQWLEAKGEKLLLEGSGQEAVFIKNNSTSHSYVLVFHPLTEKVQDMASYAFHFYELGFNVIIPDYIGNEFSFGVNESDYIVNWAELIVKIDETANVFIFGVGAGGTSSLLSSQKALPENVKGIISDSAYCDITEVFSENIKDIYGASAFPTVQLSSLYVKITRGRSFTQVDVESAVRDSEIPILYIHGTEDSIVPVGQSNRLYEITKAQGTDHFTVYGADHAQCLNTDSEKYWREVDDFIRNNI